MFKFSVGLFAGTIMGMGVAMLDKRTLKKAKKLTKCMMHDMAHTMHCCHWLNSSIDKCNKHQINTERQQIN